MTGLRTKFRLAARQYSEYRRIVSEIENLSSREAADIGLFPSDARQIARMAVYGD